MTPTERAINDLRAPIQPANGPYEIQRRVLDALAVQLEQNDTIISELQILTAHRPGPAGK